MGQMTVGWKDGPAPEMPLALLLLQLVLQATTVSVWSLYVYTEYIYI